MDRILRQQLKKILALEPGSQAALARQLGVTSTAVNLWLHSMTNSARIQAAVLAKAEEIQNKQNAAVA